MGGIGVWEAPARAQGGAEGILRQAIPEDTEVNTDGGQHTGKRGDPDRGT